MIEQPPKFAPLCPAEEIASYIDGELSGEAEAALEGHLDQCPKCRRELNEQKGFLLALSSTLIHESEIDLPKDFARRIVVTAESNVNVNTLTSRREMLIATAAALLMLSVAALLILRSVGEDVMNPSPLERFVSTSGFALQLLFDLAQGIFTILRTVASSQTFVSPAAYIVLGFAATAVLLLTARPLMRYLRIQRSE